MVVQYTQCVGIGDKTMDQWKHYWLHQDSYISYIYYRSKVASVIPSAKIQFNQIKTKSKLYPAEAASFFFFFRIQSFHTFSWAHLLFPLSFQKVSAMIRGHTIRQISSCWFVVGKLFIHWLVRTPLLSAKSIGNILSNTAAETQHLRWN